MKRITSWLPSRRRQDPQHVQDWRHLSPNQPPIPNLLAASPSSTLSFLPFRLLPTSPTQPDQTSRNRWKDAPGEHRYARHRRSQPLDPILEESEASTKPSMESTSLSHPPHVSSSVSSHDSRSSPPPLIRTPDTRQGRPGGSQRSAASSQSSSPPPTSRQEMSVEELCRAKFIAMVQAACRSQRAPSSIQMRAIPLAEHALQLIWCTPQGEQRENRYTGNMQYIPPEMFLGNSDSQGPSDVWVLGISLYHMLVGSFPFQGPSHSNIIKKMMQADFSIPTHLSEDAKDLLRRMLAPKQTRASLDLVTFHPWLKPLQPTLTPKTDNGCRVQRPPKKHRRSLSKWLLLLCQGPFPPPSKPYQELAHLGRRPLV
ncbi:hypothetical protein DM01DRAFT_1339208 [Hesseltinella vesiculosa]|uniref:Protein kinase domain-containing protein n=1 Tax=Hesseltinella vesiculosa TaxID=101127 RepID=A0A1X2G7Q5_9FUNG|nr:hypothetical protein DM01DRAFT_1339208 [Hesseltinella vesiculosa]